MNIRGLLTSAAAVATVVATALAVPVAARASSQGPGTTARTTAAGSHPPRAAFSANLHAGFARLQGHATTGPRAGIVPPLVKHGTVTPGQSTAGQSTAGQSTAGQSTGAGTGAASSPCSEPNCNLAYNGGPVQHSPHLYVLFWGPNWQTDSSQAASASYLLSFYEGLGTSGANADTWSQTTSQYYDGSGHPTFSGSVVSGFGYDRSTPPSTVTPQDLAAEAANGATAFGITDVPDAQVIVASQSGTCFSDGFADSSCTPVPATYCAWHSSTTFSGQNLSYTNLPYQLDAGFSCGENFINSGSAGTLDGFSIVGGHEYAESVTDPVPDTGYIDLNDTISGGEIGDKCAWAGELWGTPDPAGDITLSTGRFAVQSLWSNATGSCVMSGKLPFSVTPVGNQTSTIGQPVSVQVRASTTPPTPLTYTPAPAGTRR